MYSLYAEKMSHVKDEHNFMWAFEKILIEQLFNIRRTNSLSKICIFPKTFQLSLCWRANESHSFIKEKHN